MSNSFDPDTKKVIRRAEVLLEKRTRLLGLSPVDAMEEILCSDQPAALVHSFAEQDLYLMIKDIGPEDAVSLLSLASDKQWEYILDMELWSRDRLEVQSMTRWLRLLCEADLNRAVRWTTKEKTDLIELYLFKTLDIAIREHDQDPSELGERFESHDDLLYFRTKEDAALFVPEKSEMEAPEPVSDEEAEADADDGEIARKQLDGLIRKFAKKLAEQDFALYQNILLEALQLIPSEVEEEAYRIRSVRLAEKGFLPFEEAVGIYQPPGPGQFSKKPDQILRGARTAEERDLIRFRSSLSPVHLIDGPADLFSTALQEVSGDKIMPLLQEELAALCNRIISADQKEIREKEQLGQVVQKARGYISIGLAYLIGQNRDSGQNRNRNVDRTVEDPADKAAAAALIRQFPLTWIFRAGYGRVLDLKWRAQKWHEQSWFKDRGFPLTFWDETWLGVLGGLLVKKPLVFDNFQTGVLYREFSSMADVDATNSVLERIIAFDTLFSLMNISEFFVDSRRLLTYKNLLLTLWAREALGLSYKFKPMTVRDFSAFFRELFVENTTETQDRPRRIGEKTRSGFLKWLSEKSGLAIHDISARLGPSLEKLFDRIESEYGAVRARDLDPRYVQLFALERNE